MRSLLLRCYPAAWRARYGDEFEAILDERPIGPFDAADILLGALDAHLRRRGRASTIQHGKGFTMSLRIGGVAAILGGVMWPVGFYLVAGAGDGGPSNPVVTASLLVAGSLALVVALAGLSAFQARTNPVLAWASFLIPAVGTLASVVGVITLIGGGDTWVLWGLGTLTAFLGSILFAITTYRTAALSRGASVLLGVGAIVTTVTLLGAASLAPVMIVAALGSFGAGWFWLGAQAIRLDRSAPSPRPA